MLLRVGDLETRCGIAPIDGDNDEDEHVRSSPRQGNIGHGRGRGNNNNPVFSIVQGLSGGNNSSSPGVPNNNGASPHR